MAGSDVSIDAIAHDPSWLPHRYDPGHDAIHFRRVTREEHRRATFLTDEYLGSDSPVVLRRSDVVAADPVAAPVHFIFHSAYCCSTLLARAVDIDGVAMGLKEPVLLNDLVGWRHRGGDRRGIAMALDHGLRMLERPFSEGEAIVIKPSNIVNGLAPAMLAMRPASRALLLYAPLETYLASVAKKGMWGRLWVRDLLIGLLKDGSVNLGFSDDQYLGLTDLQIAAVGWLAQQAAFAQLISRLGPSRVRSLDSRNVTDQSHNTITALSMLFGLGLNDATVEQILGGQAFTRHSKFDTDFTGVERAAEHQAAIDLHRDEITKVEQWARVVADRAGVPMELPSALLG